MNVKTIITRDNRDLIKNICIIPFVIWHKDTTLPPLTKEGVKGW
jgi:hypothetical protein